MILGALNPLSYATVRHLSLRFKSYVVYGVLLAGAAAVTVFVFYQKDYLFEQFNELQEAYEKESRLREVDMTILQTIQTQVVSLESIDIDYGSVHAREHLKLLMEFFDSVITQHFEKTPEVSGLGAALRLAYEVPNRKNMSALGNSLAEFRHKLELRLEVSRDFRNTLADSFHDRSDMVAMIALVLGFLGFTMLGVINALFFTRLTHDLQSLKKRAQEIANGHREDRIPVIRSDEVGELIDSINQMASELDEHDRALEIERRKYYQQEKMAAIGVLAAGIAHEVGNPIAAISGLLEDLKQSCSDDVPKEVNVHKLDMLLEQTERLKTITREVSTFARPQLNERELLDLNGLIRNTCSLMRYDRRWKDINLDLDLDSNLPAIYGVPDHLRQVFMNLLVNAEDSLEAIADRKPVIKISTGLIEEENKISVVVQDNGRGMDAETLRHALEAFYTTKEVGKGTGLGLSLCHSIITDHAGGEIYIESTPRIGTAVRIFLPMGDNENTQVRLQ